MFFQRLNKTTRVVVAELAKGFLTDFPVTYKSTLHQLPDCYCETI